MRLNSNCFTVTLVFSLALLASSVQLKAQKAGAYDIASSLPDAPRPQLAAAGSAEQTTGQQSQKSPSPSSVDAQQETGSISGTVTDAYGNVISNAIVTLEGQIPADHRQVVANDTGGFAFENLRGNVSYRINVRSEGYVSWDSDKILIAPGQYELLKDVELKIQAGQTSVTVYGSTEQIAVEQVHLAEQQRVLGIIPNFYVVYDSKNAVPLTTKLKFKLALRVSVDPVSIGGAMFVAGINQAANTPDYVQGAKGYGQRFGAVAADSFSDIMIGGAILPSLLHQDPRYFYQGTGTTKSRLRHALLSPFICRGDNGSLQPNYSTLGGDLGSSALSNLYYPQSNRGASLVFTNFAIGTAERMFSDYAQEFILSKFTSRAKSKDTTSSDAN